MISAVFFDFGGVLTTSPFDAFERYESQAGLEIGTVRRLNSTNPHTNAWARLERGELDPERFVVEFEREASEMGISIDGARVLSCLRGEIRPEMVTALEICSQNFTTALLTNNYVAGTAEWSPEGIFGWLLPNFDAVIESARVGCRKPERRFYEIALERTGVDPTEVVFLDDLGINLKPAREMGMTTIKVTDPDAAITELEHAVGIPLR